MDVTAKPANLEDMLKLSGGARRVPVIMEEGRAAVVGFNRGS